MNKNMKKILLFSQMKHQSKYFNEIKDNLQEKYEITVIDNIKKHSISKLPKWLNTIVEKSLKYKFLEIDIKYKNKIQNYIYKKFIKINTYLITKGYLNIILKSNSDFIGMWNGTKYPQNILNGICKHYHKKCIYFENGVLPNTTSMDFQGVNAHNSISNDINIYKNYQKKENSTLPNNLISRTSKNKKNLNFEDINKKEEKIPYIFIPFQVSYDSQIIFNSPWIKNMEQLFNIIRIISIDFEGKCNFIFKEHPSDRKSNYSNLHSESKKFKNIFFDNKTCTEELIKKSLGVITINSSVGIEALLFKKPVITLGESFYNIDNITKQIHFNGKDYLSILQLSTTIHNLIINKLVFDFDTIEKFIYYLKDEYLIEDSWKKPTEKHFVSIYKKLEEYN
mgnify:CR=1 FL=1